MSTLELLGQSDYHTVECSSRSHSLLQKKRIQLTHCVLFSDVMSTSFKEVPIFKLVELEQGLSINMITLNFCAIHTYP